MIDIMKLAVLKLMKYRNRMQPKRISCGRSGHTCFRIDYKRNSYVMSLINCGIKKTTKLAKFRMTGLVLSYKFSAVTERYSCCSYFLKKS